MAIAAITLSCSNPQMIRKTDPVDTRVAREMDQKLGAAKE
jgi:hypothetical protein